MRFFRDQNQHIICCFNTFPKSKYTDFFTPDGKAYIHYSAKTTIPNANKMLKFPPEILNLDDK